MTAHALRLAARAAVAVLIIAMVLAACGSDDDETGASSSSSPDQTTTTQAPTTTEAPTTTTGEGPATLTIFLLPADADDCSKVVAVTRPATVEGELGDALTQLLAGPTAEEEAQGLRSWFSAETAGMLNSVVVEDGVAEIDFDDFSGVIPNASSSCGSASLLAQLDSTVQQAGGVDRAIYSFAGDRAAFYEWLQMSAPE